MVTISKSVGQADENPIRAKAVGEPCEQPVGANCPAFSGLANTPPYTMKMKKPQADVLVPASEYRDDDDALPAPCLLENLSRRGAPVAPAYRECDLIL